MWEQVQQIFQRAASQIVDQIANFLPGLLVSLLLVLMTVVAAVIARMLLLRALHGLEFDRRADQVGLTALVGWPASASPSLTAARIVFWTILILGLLVSLTALNATMPSRLALLVFEYVPNLLAGLVILVGGAVAARFLARSVLIGAVNMQIRSARLISLAVKWLVLTVAMAMALDHLGIGRSILLLAFGLLFGGIVLAVALAVGLGARDVVARAIERHISESAQRDDKVDHV